MPRCVWLAIATASSLAVAAPARADDPRSLVEEVVELRYSAPPGCPGRDVVEAAIRARTPNVRLAAPARRVFTIKIAASGGGFTGTLAVDEQRPDRVEHGADKQLAADQCGDLATALALVTALAIDPMAAARDPVEPPPPRPPQPRAWSQELDAGALVEMGVAPEAMLAAAVDLRATLRQTYQLELGAILGRESTTQGDGQARFTWLAARPGACRLWHAHAVAIGGCGHVEVGAVRASGDMIVNQRDLTRLWLAAGAHGSARYPLGSGIFAQLKIGASVPFVRDHYLFAPNIAIHDTPSVTGWLLIGLGVQFL